MTAKEKYSIAINNLFLASEEVSRLLLDIDTKTKNTVKRHCARFRVAEGTYTAYFHNGKPLLSKSVRKMLNNVIAYVNSHECEHCKGLHRRNDICPARSINV